MVVFIYLFIFGSSFVGSVEQHFVGICGFGLLISELGWSLSRGGSRIWSMTEVKTRVSFASTHFSCLY